MEHYAVCAATVRERDRDRYIADLYAPEPGRRHLFALHAFNAEVAGVRAAVSDPTLGEIRLQWWREALTTGGDGHPVATALVETIRTFGLPPAAFEHLLEARRHDLYDDPVPTLHDLEGYAGETVSSLYQLAALVLAGGGDPGSAEAAGHGGVAHMLTGVMRALPLHAGRAQSLLPDDMVGACEVDRASVVARRPTPALISLLAELRTVARRHLAAAERAVADLTPAIKPAFLPLAVVRRRLDRMDRPNYDPFSAGIEMTPLRRQWIIWRAARRGG